VEPVELSVKKREYLKEKLITSKQTVRTCINKFKKGYQLRM
jgi:hypothetical protein